MTLYYRVPGRIELLGKHVDYAGGTSLTCAVDRTLAVRVEVLEEPVVRLHSTAQPSVQLPLSTGVEIPTETWGTYARAVIRRLCRDFPELQRGIEITISSDLPSSAGLSSSSALTIALATALVDANGLEQLARWQKVVPDLAARAEYFGALETGAPFGPFDGDEGVGVAGGAQDHVAILCARDRHCGLFGYLPATVRRYIPWPEDYLFAIAVSGVEATKTGNARALYNRTSNSLRALLAAWNAASGNTHHSLQAALDASSQAELALRKLAFAGIGPYEGTYLGPRFEQYLEESRSIVPGAASALEALDLRAFGEFVERSQSLAESGLRNQVPETSALVVKARELGAVAASAFGAGFGGAVWSMVAREGADAFLTAWRGSYLASFGQHGQTCRFFLTSPGGPSARYVAGDL
mgnify:CR=1 FL=1